VITFPIDVNKLMADNKYRLTIKIVDFDSTTNDEVVVGTFLNHDHHNPANSGHSKRDESTNKGETLYDRFSIRECIANKKFEGKLRIDKTDASIQVNIEAKAQKTLQQLLCSNKEDGVPESLLKTSYSFLQNHCEQDMAIEVSRHPISFFCGSEPELLLVVSAAEYDIFYTGQTAHICQIGYQNTDGPSLEKHCC
jgi:hypothetical protein